MAIDVTDVRSHADIQIMHAIDVISKSNDRRKVFEEIYRGKSNGKNAEDIALKLQMSEVRVLQEALVLKKAQIIKVIKQKNRLTYIKDDFISLNKKKIVRLANDKVARERFRARLNPNASGVIIKTAQTRKNINVTYVAIDEIDSFKKVVSVRLEKGTDNVPILEETFKQGLKRILNEWGEFKDWGGEGDDLFTTRLMVNGKRMPAAFGLKGRGTKGKLTPGKLGKQGDQIQRLFKSPANIFVIQYWGQIAESVYEQMKELATAKSARGQESILDLSLYYLL